MGVLTLRTFDQKRAPLSPQKNGILIVTAEEDTTGPGAAEYKFQMAAHHVDKKDLFGKSDPYVVISKDNNGLKSVVYKTEVIKNTLDPIWRVCALLLSLFLAVLMFLLLLFSQHFLLSGFDLCSNDPHKKLTFECFDWDSDGSHDFIGAFETTVEELKTKKKFA